MATTGIVNGTIIKLKIAGSAIANLMSHDESFNTAMRDITTKDSAGDSESAPGLRSYDVSGKLLFVEGATQGFSAMLTAQQAGTLLTLVSASTVSGDTKITYSAYITSLKKTNPKDANVEVDVTFKVTGAIAIATV